jgi:hypothetical protein
MKIISFRSSTIIIDPSGVTLIISHFILWKFSVEWVVRKKKIDFILWIFSLKWLRGGKKNLTRYILDMEILVQAQIGEHPWRCCTNWMGFRLWIQIGCHLRRWGGVTTSQESGLVTLEFSMHDNLGSSIEREKIGGFSVHDLGCRDRSSHGAAIRE